MDCNDQRGGMGEDALQRLWFDQLDRHSLRFDSSYRCYDNRTNYSTTHLDKGLYICPESKSSKRRNY